jgi:aspartyl-tRNA synthetase
MFKYLGFTEKQKRNWILDGRISIGATSRRFSFWFNRLVAILGGQETIRDFIASKE